MKTQSHVKPNIHHGVTFAKESGLPMAYASNARRRFLMDDLEMLDLEIAFYDDYEGNLESEFFALSQYSELTLKRAKVQQELMSIKRINKPQTNRITDADIDRARDYPVNQLIEFTHGKSKAFCHEDKNPSMFHATRINCAICPVCNNTYDSIGILMDRDGMRFIDAVKSLINR